MWQVRDRVGSAAFAWVNNLGFGLIGRDSVLASGGGFLIFLQVPHQPQGHASILCGETPDGEHGENLAYFVLRDAPATHTPPINFFSLPFSNLKSVVSLGATYICRYQTFEV